MFPAIYFHPEINSSVCPTHYCIPRIWVPGISLDIYSTHSSRIRQLILRVCMRVYGLVLLKPASSNLKHCVKGNHERITWTQKKDTLALTGSHCILSIWNRVKNSYTCTRACTHMRSMKMDSQRFLAEPSLVWSSVLSASWEPSPGRDSHCSPNARSQAVLAGSESSVGFQWGCD